MAGTTARPERVFARFRIDPGDLPPGMVSFREAAAAADFPISPMLPSYLPESTVPPPVGYEIGDEKPYCITAVYNNLQVVLCPESGISEPPAGITGDRATIHDKPAFIGKNGIEWWDCDIHFSLVGDDIPIDELKLVAESMMLIAPYGGSWLDASK